MTGWRVVLETEDRDGVPYPNIYRGVPGETREEAIDYALTRYVGLHGGQAPLLPGWRVTGAWAAKELHIGETLRVEPVDQPIYQRAPHR